MRCIISLILVVLSLVFISCNGGEDSATTDDTVAVGSPEAASSNAAASRDTDRIVDPEVANLVASINRAAFDLYGATIQDTGSLRGLSPYTIAMVMAMTGRGAAGDTLDQIMTALFDVDPTRLHWLMNQLDLELSHHFENDTIDLNGFFSTRRAWGQSGYRVLPDYFNCFPRYYGAPFQPLDFWGDPEVSIQTVEMWLHTFFSDSLWLPYDLYTERTRLSFSAVAELDLAWDQLFDPTQTVDGEFYLLSGQYVSKEMMNQSGDFAYAEDNETRILKVPLGSGRITALFILPEVDAFRSIEGSLSLEVISDFSDLLTTQPISLTFPKMDRQYGGIKRLALEGVREAYLEDEANFTLANEADNIYLHKVYHQNSVAWDENGLSHASTTISALNGDTEPPPGGSGGGGGIIVTPGPQIPPTASVDLVFDHPFIMIIQDTVTGLILYMDRIG